MSSASTNPPRRRSAAPRRRRAGWATRWSAPSTSCSGSSPRRRPGGPRLRELGVTLEAARGRCADVPPGGGGRRGQPSPAGEGHARGALRQALGLEDDFIGTEHLLLALLIERDSRTANVILLGAPARPAARRPCSEERAPSRRRRRGRPRPGSPSRPRGRRARGASAPDAGDLMLRSPTARPCSPPRVPELGITRRRCGTRPAVARRVTPPREVPTDAAPPAPRAAVAGHAPRRRRGRGVVRYRGRGPARSRRLPHHAADAHARAVPRGSRPTARTRYLPGVDLPRELRIEPAENGLGRVDYVFLGVPSVALAGVISDLSSAGSTAARRSSRSPRGSCRRTGSPRRAAQREPRRLARRLRGRPRTRTRWSPRAPASSPPRPTRGSPRRSPPSSRAPASSASSRATRSGVELAGAAKNAAALAAGATQRQGLNAAGAAAGHIFLEVWRYAEQQGARPESMIGLAGTGDLVGTALAPQSRNRQAGELLAQGVPAAEIPGASGRRSRRSTSCRCSPTRSPAPTSRRR